MKGLTSVDGDRPRGRAAGQRCAGHGAGRCLSPLRRLRHLAERQTRPLLPEATRKGAFFRSNRATVRYTVCVRFPGGGVRLQDESESQTGRAVRQRDHHQHPGQAPGELVRRGQAGRRLQLPRAALTVVGFDTATDDTAVCAVRDGEVLRESLLGPSDRGGPRAHHGAAGRGRERRRGGRRLGRGRPDRGRCRARLLHRAADRDRHRAGARPRASGSPWAASAPSTRSARALGEADGERERWRSSTPAAARSSPPSTRPRASASGSRSSAPPSSWRSGSQQAETALWRRIGGGTISGAADESGRRDPGRRRPRAPGRRAPRLRLGGDRAERGRLRSRRPDLPEAPRRGTLA